MKEKKLGKKDTSIVEGHQTEGSGKVPVITRVVNVDPVINLACEEPVITTHDPLMIEKVGQVLDVQGDVH